MQANNMKKSAILVLITILVFCGFQATAFGQISNKIPDWRFTPEDYDALIKGGGDLTFAPDSDWVPKEVKDNIKETIKDLLDPKKEKRNTTGVFLQDFYHGHVVVERLNKEAREAQEKMDEKSKKVNGLIKGDKPSVEEMGKWQEAVATEKKVATDVLDKVIKGKWGILYHTFELNKPQDMDPNDPRRNLFTPAGGKPKEGAVDWPVIMDIEFLIDKNGNIHVAPQRISRFAGLTPSPKKAPEITARPAVPEGGKIILEPPDKDAGRYVEKVVDKDGNTLSKDSYSDYKIKERRIYKGNNPVHVEKYRYENGQIIIMYSCDIGYHPNGKESESTCNFYGTDGTNLHVFLKYDEKGHEIVREEYRTDQWGKKFTRKAALHYDDLGRPYDLQIEEFEDGKQVGGKRVITEYKTGGPTETYKKTWDPKTQRWSEPMEETLEKPKALETLPRAFPSPFEPIGAKVNPKSFYIEPRVGLTGFGVNHDFTLVSHEPTELTNIGTRFKFKGNMNLAASAGVSVGTWFNYWNDVHPIFPYLGFSLNYMYQDMEYGPNCGCYCEEYSIGGQDFNLAGNSRFRSNGSLNTLGFMFNGRYGFLPDDQLPFGRMEVWGGVGPSLNFVNQTPTVKFSNLKSINGEPTYEILDFFQKFNSSSAVVPGLQVGLGLRYNFYPWLSLGTSIQYDHFSPSFNLTGPAGLSGHYNNPVDKFIWSIGAAYQF